GLTDGDEQKMRAEIKANLEREILKRVRTKLKDQVMQAILDSANIEAPKALIDQEIQRLVEEARENFEERGMKFDASKITPEIFQSKADYRVKLGLILAELVKVNDLKAQPEQVRKVIEDSAQSYENPAEVVKWHYASPDRLQEAQSVVLEDNVVMWALEQVKVVDKKTTFDELMGIT
ncbi:MAG: trigger factor, partial [Nitrosomonas sp.]|nr:trigger factor [Nitrosomonas sp.]